MKTKKSQKQYCYYLRDGRTVLSPCCLDYAMDNEDLSISLERVTANDFKKTTILANTFAAGVIELFNDQDDATWCLPEERKADARTVPFHQNYCVMINGEPYIRNGKKYESLDAFCGSASQEELEYVLRQVCVQAALAHLELTRLEDSAV